MPLNLARRSSDDFVPYVRYAAQSGVFSTRDNSGQTIEVDNFTAIADFAQIKTGWLKYSVGEPPDLVWDVDGKTAARPSKDHRRGFVLSLYSRENLYGVRELSSTNGGLIEAIVVLFDEYERAPEAVRGLLPVIKCIELKPIQNQFGQFWDPVLKIIDWVPRPPQLSMASRSAVPPGGIATSAAVVPSPGKDLDDEIPF